jgi:hypothetical protein
VLDSGRAQEDQNAVGNYLHSDEKTPAEFEPQYLRTRNAPYCFRCLHGIRKSRTEFRRKTSATATLHSQRSPLIDSSLSSLSAELEDIDMGLVVTAVAEVLCEAAVVVEREELRWFRT